jgi:trans-aconitate 2-methyltransferase
MGQWNPDLYLRFGQERTRPSLDLVNRIPLEQPRSILDVGCGPGNSTATLSKRWPAAEVTGLDSSQEMIEKAKRDYPQGKWVLADLAAFTPNRQWDLVSSSATLQWLPDHKETVPQLLSWVSKGGVLAIQVPANNNSPLHHAFQEVAARPRWSARTMAPSRLLNYKPAAYYYDLVGPLVSSLDLWETTYYHVLDSHGALIEWYRSTAMRPCLSQLSSDAERAEFEQEVLETCRSQFPVQEDGRVLYPFRRLFFVGTK